jgi:hypothetical protein
MTSQTVDRSAVDAKSETSPAAVAARKPEHAVNAAICALDHAHAVADLITTLHGASADGSD